MFFNTHAEDEKKRLLDEFYYNLGEIEDLRVITRSNVNLRNSISNLKNEYDKEKRNYENIIELLEIIRDNGIEEIKRMNGILFSNLSADFKKTISRIDYLLIKINNIDKNYNEVKNTIGNSEKKAADNFPYNTFDDNGGKVSSVDSEIFDINTVLARSYKNELLKNSKNKKSKNNSMLPDLIDYTNLEKSKNGRVLSEPIELKDNENHVNTEKSKELYFISHSSIDADKCEKIAYFLEDIGIPKDSIRCTSLTDYDVPLGNDIIEFIKGSFKHDITVIYVISENYFNSRYCLNEMGATWITESEHFTVKLDECKIEDCVLPSTEKYVKFNSDGFAEIYKFLKSKNKIKSKDYTELNRLIRKNLK
ncbi:toll/interleukin-1 receptor domain-containing protein [Mammaliicoccus sciuri]|uniref:toll/interleukin-1 receptor domain-containing protein n=1 Tax=Mammaliicoccus sciuri TaxID=1296 RepID=UPI003A8F5F70